MSTNVQYLGSLAEIKQALKPVNPPPPKFAGKDKFALLGPEEVKKFNEWYRENVKVYLVDVGREEAIAMLGLEECNSTQEAPTIVLQKKSYIARNNPHNRLWSKSVVECYKEDVIAGLWALGDPLYWAADGFAVSAQHRLLTVVIASEIDPTIRIPFLLIVGLPEEFADIIDRQRRRTVKDVTFRSNDIPTALLSEGVAEPTPETFPKQRDTLSSIYSTARSYILLRLKGKNVHASGSTNTEREIMQVQQRFGVRTLESGEQVNALVYLCWLVYRASLSDSGKIRNSFERFPHAQLVSALVLYSNRNNTDPTDLEIDFEFAEEFLEALRESTDVSGPMAVAIDAMARAKKELKKASIPRENTMHSIVGMVGQFAENRQVLTSPYPTKREQGKEKVYPCFGGVDIGYVETRKKKEE